MLVRILSYLTPKELRENAVAVSRYWKERSNDLWREIFVRENGLPFNVSDLVQTKRFTWKEAYRYSKAVLPFLDREAEVHMGASERFNDANPLHSSGNPDHRSQFFYLTLPQPFAQNRGSQFSICNSTDVRVMESGAKEPSFLRGTSGQLLSHVTVFGDSVFALRCDGRVEEWNHRTKASIRTIETAYSQEDPRLKTLKDTVSAASRQKVDMPICSSGQFVVGDGFIAIAHGSSLGRVPIHFIEMIPLSGGQRYTLPQSGSPQTLQINNGRLLVLNRSSITVHFLNVDKPKKEHPLLKDDAMMLTAMTNFGNTIYAASTEKKIYISDIERGLITTVTIPSFSHNIFAWSNLLFFEHNTEENTGIGKYLFRYHIDVIDQTKGNGTAGQQSDILTEKGFKPDLYEKLMLICKNHLKPLRLPPPKKQSNCVVM